MYLILHVSALSSIHFELHYSESSEFRSNIYKPCGAGAPRNYINFSNKTESYKFADENIVREVSVPRRGGLLTSGHTKLSECLETRFHTSVRRIELIHEIHVRHVLQLSRLIRSCNLQFDCNIVALCRRVGFYPTIGTWCDEEYTYAMHKYTLENYTTLILSITTKLKINFAVLNSLCASYR
jgi:hypothetical protein